MNGCISSSMVKSEMILNHLGYCLRQRSWIILMMTENERRAYDGYLAYLGQELGNS